MLYHSFWYGIYRLIKIFFFQEKMFHFWFNTFFVREKVNSEYDNGELLVERATRALSCDGTAMECPMVTSHVKSRTGSLASLGSMPPTLVLRIGKSELDKAHKDTNNKLYSEDFKVSCIRVMIISIVSCDYNSLNQTYIF